MGILIGIALNLQIDLGSMDNLTILKTMGLSKSPSKKEIYSNTGIPQETRKISNKQPNLPLKIIRKKNKQRPKSAEGRK